jgi:hypothetical protein
MDDVDPFSARGVPMSFQDYRVWRRTGEPSGVVRQGVPDESAVVEPL